MIIIVSITAEYLRSWTHQLQLFSQAECSSVCRSFCSFGGLASTLILWKKKTISNNVIIPSNIILLIVWSLLSVLYYFQIYFSQWSSCGSACEGGEPSPGGCQRCSRVRVSVFKASLSRICNSWANSIINYSSPQNAVFQHKLNYLADLLGNMGGHWLKLLWI